MSKIKILTGEDLKKKKYQPMMNFSIQDHQYLIQAEELYKYIDDSRLLIFDCRFRMHDEEEAEQEYLNSHIPNSHYIHLNKDMSRSPKNDEGRHPLPEIKDFEKLLASYNMNKTRQVIVYDDQMNSISARLWWMFRWIGHQNVAILDGGLKRWLSLDYPMSSLIPKVYREGDFSINVNRNMIASVEDVEMNTYTQDQLVIDSRASDRFHGQNETLDKKAGHIPHAVNQPFMDNLNEDGRFKSQEKLKSQFEATLRGFNSKDVILSCGSGVTACNNIFAMEYAGLSGAKLFVGSWSQWITDEKRKIIV